ncbi:MAG: hypothetical protein ACKO0M_10985, partial [Cyanobium sp.]
MASQHDDQGQQQAPPSGDGIVLTAEQAAARDRLLEVIQQRGEAALLGSAGTGKTTVTRAVLQALGPDDALV